MANTIDPRFSYKEDAMYPFRTLIVASLRVADGSGDALYAVAGVILLRRPPVDASTAEHDRWAAADRGWRQLLTDRLGGEHREMYRLPGAWASAEIVP